MLLNGKNKLPILFFNKKKYQKKNLKKNLKKKKCNKKIKETEFTKLNIQKIQK